MGKLWKKNIDLSLLNDCMEIDLTVRCKIS